MNDGDRTRTRHSLDALANKIAQCRSDLQTKPDDALLTYMVAHFEARAAELTGKLRGS